MSRAYIFDEYGNLVEELDHSVDGGIQRYCHKCHITTYHYLTAISSSRGEVYACSLCGNETPEY